MRRLLVAVVVLAGVTAPVASAGAQSTTQPTTKPTIALNPTCDSRIPTWSITASGTMPYAGAPVWVSFDYGGTNHKETAGTVRKDNTYSITFRIQSADHAGTEWTVAAYVPDTDRPTPTPGTYTDTTFRSPCTTNTTTTPTVTIPSDNVPPPSTTPPPPTPVATLTVTPALGPPGFVTSAHGTGFPPGPVGLAWSPGLGGASATADAAGTFTVPVLILHKDIVGPRTLTAVGGTVTASAAFLVVPATAQPRRFIARR